MLSEGENKCQHIKVQIVGPPGLSPFKISPHPPLPGVNANKAATRGLCPTLLWMIVVGCVELGEDKANSIKICMKLTYFEAQYIFLNLLSCLELNLSMAGLLWEKKEKNVRIKKLE